MPIHSPSSTNSQHSTLNSQPTPPEQLTETILDWQSKVQVEHESRTLRNVALAGTKSQNGYVYAEAALRNAAPLYERVPVFLDHPASVQQPRNRSTRDLAGRVRNVRFENNRLRGDLELFDTEAGRTLLALAESDGPGVGMSHVVLAERARDGATVQKIIEVISVDAVMFPATTTTFREARHSRAKSPRDFNVRPRGLAAGATIGRKAATLPGSLERLIAAIDRQLPGHVAPLAESNGLPCPGSATRLAVFPRHIVIEWRYPGHPPRQFAIPWTLDAAGVHLAERLENVEGVERKKSWQGRLGTFQEKSRAATKTITSEPRRATNSRPIDDAMFIRTLCRR